MAEQTYRVENSGRLADRLPIPNEPLTPQQFAQILLDKHIPTTYDRSVQGATAILEANPPELFLNRLADGFHFISKESFDTNLKKMAVALTEKAQEGPFHYIYFPVSRSSHWIYEQLCGLGLKKAASEISTGEGLSVTPKMIRGKTNLYIIEDWLISTAHVKNQILDLVWEASGKGRYPKVHAYVLYSSAWAEKRLKRIMLTYGLQILKKFRYLRMY